MSRTAFFFPMTGRGPLPFSIATSVSQCGKDEGGRMKNEAEEKPDDYGNPSSFSLNPSSFR
jgi:hypothetical protein